MSDKFVWTRKDTSLLLSLWSDNSVQKNFEETPRNIAIWYGIARYMRKRGIDVNWLQCRQRMKRLVGRYRKIKRGATLNLNNVTDSFFQELDLVFNQNRRSMETDSELNSSSVDVSNETTAVETRQPQYVNIQIHNQTLELNECSQKQDLKPPTLGIKLSRHKPSTVAKRRPGRPSRARPRPSSEVQVNDIDLSELPSNVNSIKVVLETKGGPVSGNQDAEHLDSMPGMPLWNAYVDSTNSENPTRSSSKEKDHNYVVKHAIANESETITKILLAQAETTRRLLEGNRTQQERLESRMDQILGQLEQMVPVSSQVIAKKLETKLNSVLIKLDQIIPQTNVGLHTAEQILHRKIEVVLERLEHIIPCIQQYSSSAPNLVDKIDRLLKSMDKVAPYASNVVEVNTAEQS